MRAMAIQSFGGVEKLQPMVLPRPLPEKCEVLVRAVAAGVNPVDWKIREGWLAALLPHAFPLVPGWDVAGVVEELGDGASRFRPGERVWAYARKPLLQWGCYAEFVTVADSALAVMPGALTFEEAAAVPLAALTAWQSLFFEGDLPAGTTVLVHAAAGGVGHFAVQLARRAGARVFGTAGPANASFVLGLGAEACVDYTKEDFRQPLRRLCPGGLDLVLDAVGGNTLARSYELCKPGGRLVSLVDEPDSAEARRRGIRAHSHFVEPHGEQLAGLARLIERQQLRPHVQRIYPLEHAGEAQRASAGGHVRGKLVLHI